LAYFYLVDLEALAPLLEGDLVVVVLVAVVEEGRDAVLQRHEGCADREELVARDRTVVWVTVEVAPLPDGGVGPAAGHVALGLAFHLLVEGRQLVAVSHVAHDVEQPVAHTPGEVVHLLVQALLQNAQIVILGWGSWTVFWVTYYKTTGLFSKP
jgi:hypothetical protein